jgi:L-ascorbate metabolism protein UlaG (beta-lactamase superfamily)
LSDKLTLIELHLLFFIGSAQQQGGSMKTKCVVSLAFVLSLGLTSLADAQGLVKITPIGSHDHRFCANDRALLFEDPTGLRILYDPGRSVGGGTDPRLGTVHVMILTSVHVDHIGDVKANLATPGSCAAPSTLPATPNSNFAEIAAAKKSTVIAGGEMHTYLAAKITAAGGSVVACPGTENLTVTDPPTLLRTCILRHGGKRIVHLGSAQGVQIAVIRADHSNGVARTLLSPSSDLATDLTPDGLTAYAGPENGFVITFTNGLVVYLSGDTGHTSDMATIVNDYYGAELAVMHMGDVFSMGPEEAAFAVKKLIKAKSAIAEHANEEATATNGIVNPNSRTARFIDLLKGIPAYAPLSGVTMQFDQHGKCVSGC